MKKLFFSYCFLTLMLPHHQMLQHTSGLEFLKHHTGDEVRDTAVIISLKMDLV
jgi:hypothetical protein